jgi:hypothetical protein
MMLRVPGRIFVGYPDKVTQLGDVSEPQRLLQVDGAGEEDGEL